MPRFQPLTARELMTRFAMRVVAVSGLEGLNELDAYATMIGLWAEEFAGADARVSEMTDEYGFKARGRRLDDRVGQLPPSTFAGRREATHTAGNALQVIRAPAVDAATYAVGTIVCTRKDRPGMLYVNVEPLEFAAGQAVYPDESSSQLPLRIACVSAGALGNASVGQIDTTYRTPPGIVSVKNIGALTTGLDREGDPSLQNRSEDYLASLPTRVQPRAIEFIARSFTSSDGQRARHARVLRDPFRPGYVELSIDDGFGLRGLTRAGKTTSGVVPDNGQPYLWFDAPAASKPRLYLDGVEAVEVYGVEPDWRWELELGLVHFKDSSVLLAPGVEWEIRGHEVYYGLPAELQRLLLGITASGQNDPGYTSSGCRVRVTRPEVDDLPITMAIALKPGWSLATQTGEGRTLRDDIVDFTISFVADIAPEQPFIRWQHLARLDEFPAIDNVDLPIPAADVYPARGRRLSTRADLITISSYT